MGSRYLICCDWQGTPASERIEVDLVRRGGELLIDIDAPFHGDPAPAQPAGRLWELWEHEVVELFIAGPAPESRYIELEFGPHGHYLVLALHGERNIVDHDVPLKSYRAWRDDDRWRGHAELAAELLPAGPHRFNAYGMHGASPRQRYALHPLQGAEADFHQLSSFEPIDL